MSLPLVSNVRHRTLSVRMLSLTLSVYILLFIYLSWLDLNEQEFGSYFALESHLLPYISIKPRHTTIVTEYLAVHTGL